ncbi:RDD family protein [Wenjunlia vitaminophila]|uniref:RDD family protein n=1 Tax=Wenjunlia vitaminophila TaxID=76728 RepID=UPI000A41A4C6|nr:RDD family protein [Wenjunlia vitaminophila]
MTSGSGDAPRAGYYTDPSIPGYIRYWDGAAWVPGTSRPEPAPGEVLTPPPGLGPVAEPPQHPTPTPPPTPAPSQSPQHPASPQHPTPGPEPRLQSEPGPEPRPGQGQPEPGEPTGSPGTPGRPAPAPTAQLRQTPAGQPAAARPRRVEESGPVFLDEEDQEEATWSSGVPRQGAGTQQPRVSWGGPQPSPPADPVPPAQAQASRTPPAPGHPGQAHPGHGQPSYGQPAQGRPAHGQPGPGSAAPGGQPRPAQPGPDPSHPGEPRQVPWAQQVQRLAHADPVAEPAATPGQRSEPSHVVGQTFGDNALAWRPPPSNPFLSAVSEARPSSVGRRLVARLIDSVLLCALLAAAAVPLARPTVDHVRDKIDEAEQTGETVRVWLIDGTTGAYLGAFLGAALLLCFLYEVLPTARWGRTLGKRLVRVKVLDIEGQEPPTVGRALRRWLVYQVLFLVVVGLVNVFWCVVDRPWRQCWHDKAAKTFVAADPRG